MKTLEDCIKNSGPAHANKFTERQVDDMAESVRTFLRTREESVEGLFNCDDDSYIGVVKIKNI